MERPTSIDSDLEKTVMLLVFAAYMESQLFFDSHEDLGQKSARLMKHLRSKGAPALRHTRIAAERREEMALGVPILRFVHGMDFASPALPSSADQQPG